MSREALNHKSNGNGHFHVKEKYMELAEAFQKAASQKKKAIHQIKRAAEDALYDGKMQVKGAVKKVNRNVKKNPWAFIGGTAAGALILGYLLGKKE